MNRCSRDYVIWNFCTLNSWYLIKPILICPRLKPTTVFFLHFYFSFSPKPIKLVDFILHFKVSLLKDYGCWLIVSLVSSSFPLNLCQLPNVVIFPVGIPHVTYRWRSFSGLLRWQASHGMGCGLMVIGYFSHTLGCRDFFMDSACYESSAGCR